MSLLLNKTGYVRSEKLTKSAEGQPCTMNVAGVCSYDYATTVLAHVDTEDKGRGIKSSDIAGMYACHKCHEWYDLHKGSEEDRLFYSLRAMVRTQHIMIREGLLSVA